MSDKQGTSQEALSEMKDGGNLEIVEIQCEKDNLQEASQVVYTNDQYENVSCMEVVDGSGKSNVLDLLNMTLIKCYTAEGETYKLVSNNSECDDETVVCILSNEDGVQEQFMVDNENLYAQTEYVENEQTSTDTVNQKPSPQWILEKAKAYQQSKALLASLQRRQRKGRRRKGELPPAHELLTSPSFKLYLYSCKMCNFKCNAIKELQAHRASEHAGGNTYRGRNAIIALQCPKCPYRAHTQAQLSKHINQSHVKRETEVKYSEPINLDTDEVNAADVLVCGACGFESPSKDNFRTHIQEEHGALAMAPVKFGLFKTRSREPSEQPSTENLLQSSHSIDQAGSPHSPIPSTSKGLVDLSPLDFAVLNLDDDDDVLSEESLSRRSSLSKIEEADMNYRHLHNPSLTSTSTLDEIHIYDEPATHIDLSTSYDAHSSQFDINSSQFDINSSQFDINSQFDASEFDAASIAPSEDLSVYCAMMKKSKKRSKEQQLRDIDMWQASNIEVMQNLLNRSGTLDEQIKWEAIATARGLCTLTDSCTCDDCTGAKYLAGITDGDGGLGTAPLFNAINVGCQIQ